MSAWRERFDRLGSQVQRRPRNMAALPVARAPTTKEVGRPRIARVWTALTAGGLLTAVLLAGCGSSSSSPTAVTVATTRTGTHPARPGPNGSAAGALRGSRRGLALLAEIEQAYRAVPAVIITAPIGGAPAQFVIVLHDGVVVAEQFAGGQGRTATRLVAPEQSPTYALEPGTSCWRRLASSDPQALTDIGKRFPETFGETLITVAGPVRRSTGLLLRLREGQSTTTFSIDAHTRLVDSITVTKGGRSITEHVQPLTAKPTLYSPAPACP